MKSWGTISLIIGVIALILSILGYELPLLRSIGLILIFVGIVLIAFSLRRTELSSRTITLTAICIAIIYAFVASTPIPIAATGGYTHPGAVAEIFVAIAFGPIIGLVAAGIGAAIADLTLGYGGFAPLTLVAHGSLGLLAGWLGWKKGWSGMVIGWIVGGLALVGIYYIGEATAYGLSATAGAEVPFNLVQVALGILGIVLFERVKQSYPQVEHLAEGPTFTEE